MEAIFDDPVTFEVMKDAVVSSCGHSFSMASISQWLETHDTCPICKQTLRISDCIPNYALRTAIDQFVRDTAPPTVSPPAPEPAPRSSSLDRININAILNSDTEIFCNVREMRTEHADRGGCLMEAAFRDAAYTRYFYPEFDDFSMQAMTWFYTRMIQYAMQSGRAWGAYEGNVLKGVALWQPPYESGVSMWGMIKTGMAAAPWNLGVKAAWRVLSILDQAEKKHKQTISTPHWALYSVGVDPDVHGRGIGTQLLQPILDMADADALPCYLDTPSHRSLPFFQRLGFEVVFNVSDPSSGPRFWTMLRRPQRLRR